MGWKPQLNIACGRCGEPRGGLRHVCLKGGNRKATVKPAVTFGKCPECKKPVANPLTHTCAPKSDFKRRRAKFEKDRKAAARAKARKKRQQEKHDYQACADIDCPRPLCVAHKTGWKTGYQQGHEDGFSQGFPAGVAACPRNHSS